MYKTDQVNTGIMLRVCTFLVNNNFYPFESVRWVSKHSDYTGGHFQHTPALKC